MADEELAVGVACGRCQSGPVFFETCEHPDGCDWALASECQNCGARFLCHDGLCPDGHAA